MSSVDLGVEEAGGVPSLSLVTLSLSKGRRGRQMASFCYILLFSYYFTLVFCSEVDWFTNEVERSIL